MSQNSLVKVRVNDVEVEVPSGSTALQACELAGFEIPRFCLHERLLVAGNCRMCLVEVEKSPKPVASCAMPLMPNMQIFTDSPLVRKAREGVVEFLLMNHPLDCPICDQGGECDLQDQTMAYGGDRSRFYHTYKRGVEDKDCGPLIQTIMTRCISCSRCVRFASEIAGEGSLGMTNRGVGVEVGTFIPKLIRSEMSGNLIDLCPVGALTSKPYAFKARPWELVDTDTVDTMDSLGSNIRVQTRGNDVLRVLPVKNDDINQDWITDKSRFCLDAFDTDRVSTPMDNSELLLSLVDNLSIDNDGRTGIQFVFGPHVDTETVFAARSFCSRFNANPVLMSDFKGNLNTDWDGTFSLQTGLNGLEESDCILLVGVDLKQELPLLNARLRSSFLRDRTSMAHLGSTADSGFPVPSAGLGMSDFTDFVNGTHSFCSVWAAASNPKLILSSSLLEGPQNNEVRSLINTFSTEAGYASAVNLLQLNASSVGSSVLGLGGEVAQGGSGLNAYTILVFVGVDPNEDLSGDSLSFLMKNYSSDGDVFTVSFGAFRSFTDVHEQVESGLPLEVSGTFVNAEGRVQQTVCSVSRSFSSFSEDFIPLLSMAMGLKGKNSFSLEDLYDFSPLDSETFVDYVPNIGTSSGLPEAVVNEKGSFFNSVVAGQQGVSNLYSRTSDDFWITDPVSRRSKTLAKASQAFAKKSPFKGLFLF